MSHLPSGRIKICIKASMISVSQRTTLTRQSTWMTLLILAVWRHWRTKYSGVSLSKWLWLVDRVQPGWNKKSQAFISPTVLSVVGQSDFKNDWLQFCSGKFVTWRDRMRFLYILLAEFHNNNDEPDIVFIELSVNDYGCLHGATARPVEPLTWRVLTLK